MLQFHKLNIDQFKYERCVGDTHLFYTILCKFFFKRKGLPNSSHKRKNNFSTNDNDEISGSGDISNLAMVTLSYGKDKNIGEGQRLLKVSKNRLFGKVNTDGWILEFNEKSKRIYGAGDDVNVDYGWNKQNDGFYEAEEETPFD